MCILLHSLEIYKYPNFKFKVIDLCSLHELKFCYKLENNMLPRYLYAQLFKRNFKLNSYTIVDQINFNCQQLNIAWQQSCFHGRPQGGQKGGGYLPLPGFLLFHFFTPTDSLKKRSQCQLKSRLSDLSIVFMNFGKIPHQGELVIFWCSGQNL